MLDMDKFTLHSHEAVLMIIDIQQRLASVMERREQVVKTPESWLIRHKNWGSRQWLQNSIQKA